MSYIEMIYIDDQDQARKTNVALSLPTAAETWAAFKALKPRACDIKEARFLCDYHNAKGDLSDSIPLSAEDFASITGHPVKAEADYIEFDAEYWNTAREAQP